MASRSTLGGHFRTSGHLGGHFVPRDHPGTMGARLDKKLPVTGFKSILSDFGIGFYQSLGPKCIKFLFIFRLISRLFFLAISDSNFRCVGLQNLVFALKVFQTSTFRGNRFQRISGLFLVFCCALGAVFLIF